MTRKLFEGGKNSREEIFQGNTLKQNRFKEQNIQCLFVSSIMVGRCSFAVDYLSAEQLYYVPSARHYKPRLVYFLPHFSVRFIIKSG